MIQQPSGPATAVGARDMANALRALAMDAVQRAKSGHPGMPMGFADVATVLVSKFLKFDATAPAWPDRDRLVLSAGHGSMLLYGLLHLTGNARITLDELKNFRQLGARTAGHPEYDLVGGIETTTGPLGQGLANAVGMATAERHLAARFGAELVDHYTYVIAGDGCLMEGISHEAISLAGHLKLGKLIVLFDDNGISIDGPTSLSVSDDMPARFKASGWHVQSVDGHDPEAVAAAIAAARTAAAPSMIACRTIIGFGSPNKQGTAATHGAPLGDDEVQAARKTLGWDDDKAFEVPAAIRDAWQAVGTRGGEIRQAWEQRLAASDRRREFEDALDGRLPAALEGAVADHKRALIADAKPMATRKASQAVLEVINRIVPTTLGGSADLTGSNNTRTVAMTPLTADDYGGRYMFYGVREHAMAAAMNGIALHKGLIPYGGTFLVFSDYARPAIRLAALMGLPVIFVMTHDSIGLGEDGPTHQPVEHLASLRAIPNLWVMRPADAVETAECWELALRRRNGPSLLALTRQNLPLIRAEPEAGVGNGASEVAAADGAAQVNLLATGSEVSLALAVRERLASDGIAARVVSMPCWELFERQDKSARDAVLGTCGLRVGIEAAARFGWERWLGADGLFCGVKGFGTSAPYQDAYRHFGLTAEAIAEEVMARL